MPSKRRRSLRFETLEGRELLSAAPALRHLSVTDEARPLQILAAKRSKPSKPVLAGSYTGLGISRFLAASWELDGVGRDPTPVARQETITSRGARFLFRGTTSKGAFYYVPTGIGTYLSGSLYPMQGTYKVANGVVSFSAVRSYSVGVSGNGFAQVIGSFRLPAKGSSASATIVHQVGIVSVSVVGNYSSRQRHLTTLKYTTTVR